MSVPDFRHPTRVAEYDSNATYYPRELSVDEATRTLYMRKSDNSSDIILIDPTVPDWAREESKPTYTADEVGAVGYTEQSPTDEQKSQARINIGFTDENALIVATETGLIDPVTDETGAIFADENNVIYTI